MLYATSNDLGFPLLALVVFLPAAGAALVALLGPRNRSLHAVTGVFVSGLTLILASLLLVMYDPNWLVAPTRPAFQFGVPATGPATWLPAGITFQLAVDGIGVVLVFLTALLGFVALVFSWQSVRARQREYFALMLLLETGLLGVFCSLDLFLFFVFWELTLIPMYLLIGVWGGRDRVYATTKFVIFTITGSSVMLVAIVSLTALTGSSTYHLFDILQRPALDPRWQLALFAAFALAFAVKVPLFPLHTWLPDAHVEAPTAGSVILAGVLLKMGAYGFVRLAVPLFPLAAREALPLIFVLALVGIWYGAWVAFAQTDMKSLVAYSSISHMGLIVAALFALNVQAMSGGVLQMVNHGLSTGALFLLVGMLYDRAHARDIQAFGGLWTAMPRFAAVFLVVMLSSIGLPGTNGFVGEWLSILGVFRANMLAGGLAAFGVVLSAAYMLWLYQRVFFGPPRPGSAGFRDLGIVEMAALVPLLIGILWIGLYPDTVLAPIARSCQAWLTVVIAPAATAMP